MTWTPNYTSTDADARRIELVNDILRKESHGIIVDTLMLWSCIAVVCWAMNL